MVSAKEPRVRLQHILEQIDTVIVTMLADLNGGNSQ
jgi:hypothetical protein